MFRCADGRCTPQRPLRVWRLPSPFVARRSLPLLASAALALGALWSAGAAWSQSVPAPPGHRIFPATALRGALVIDAPPVARLNGQPARLAPGARIRGENGLLQTPASLVGRALTVHYTWEPSTGLLMDVWILNPVEQANSPWPTNGQDAKAWRFDPAAQRWSRP